MAKQNYHVVGYAVVNEECSYSHNRQDNTREPSHYKMGLIKSTRTFTKYWRPHFNKIVFCLSDTIQQTKCVNNVIMRKTFKNTTSWISL